MKRRVGGLLAAGALLAAGGAAVPSAVATPGGLDQAGGHHCWTRCASYGIRRGDYHCHRDTARCRRSDRSHRAHGH